MSERCPEPPRYIFGHCNLRDVPPSAVTESITLRHSREEFLELDDDATIILNLAGSVQVKKRDVAHLWRI